MRDKKISLDIITDGEILPLTSKSDIVIIFNEMKIKFTKNSFTIHPIKD